MFDSEAITLAMAARRSWTLTAKVGGRRSLLAWHRSGGHASESFGLFRLSSVLKSTGPRSAGPIMDHNRFGPIKNNAKLVASAIRAKTTIADIAFNPNVPREIVAAGVPA